MRAVRRGWCRVLCWRKLGAQPRVVSWRQHCTHLDKEFTQGSPFSIAQGCFLAPAYLCERPAQLALTWTKNSHKGHHSLSHTARHNTPPPHTSTCEGVQGTIGREGTQVALPLPLHHHHHHHHHLPRRSRRRVLEGRRDPCRTRQQPGWGRRPGARRRTQHQPRRRTQHQPRPHWAHRTGLGQGWTWRWGPPAQGDWAGCGCASSTPAADKVRAHRHTRTHTTTH